MSNCAVKRGIITLRDCRNPVTGTCSQCSRDICTEHTTAAGICVECNVRNAEQKDRKGFSALGDKSTKPARSTAEPAPEQYEDPSWPFYYRHHYYSSYHYSPFYMGSYY